MAVASPQEIVSDEVVLLATRLTLAGASVVDLGCGNGNFARSLISKAHVASVDAFEVDRTQHARNLAAPPVPGLSFHEGGAEAIALPDASRDLTVMMKSLHHVPMRELDRALLEIRRVLRPGGHLYVSEPVYAGEFNDIVKLFHDEGEVRAAAQAAVERAVALGVFELAQKFDFMAPIAFASWEQFVERIVRATHSEHVLTPALESEVRERFGRYLGAAGAQFIRPMRAHLLRKPA